MLSGQGEQSGFGELEFSSSPSQVNIADFQDNQWVTCFQESAEAILGQNTAHLGELKEKVRVPFMAMQAPLAFPG